MSATVTNDDSVNKVNGYKKQSSEQEDGEEIKIDVPWGHVSGKWWGPKDQQPLVAIHGWQDNAGSFDTLAPLLSSDIAILSIDLPGHGCSTHLPSGQFYYVFWDGVITLRRIVKNYKWQKVKLLGHSLGGGISFLYAASYPDEVELFISLDIASPNVRKVTSSVTTTGEAIDKFLKYETLSSDSMPCYDYENMRQIVEDAYQGSVNRKGAEILMKRGMRPAGTIGFHNFTRDPKLKVSLLGMLSMDLVLAYAARIKCAYLNIRAKSGLKLDEPENYDKVLNQIKLHAKKFEYHEVEGTHHVHLINPERVAPIIQNFLRS